MDIIVLWQKEEELKKVLATDIDLDTRKEYHADIEAVSMFKSRTYLNRYI